MMKQSTKLFMNGRSQAVRIPAAFRFDTEEVWIEKKGDTITLKAKPKKTNWDDFFNSKLDVGEDFMIERDDSPPQERKIFD